MNIKPDATIKDVLTQSQSEKTNINITLRSGNIYQGKVVNIGPQNVRIKLTGTKSFYDAFIKIEDISAIEVQVRTS
ncbi:MAG: hypothetical protein ACFFDN_04040 [Candidatus Hodarchaeota archaeon]